MPLTDENIKQINKAAALIEKTHGEHGEYGEIHLIYKRPNWRHIKIVQGETMLKDCVGKNPNKTE